MICRMFYYCYGSTLVKDFYTNKIAAKIGQNISKHLFREMGLHWLYWCIRLFFFLPPLEDRKKKKRQQKEKSSAEGKTSLQRSKTFVNLLFKKDRKEKSSSKSPSLHHSDKGESAVQCRDFPFFAHITCFLMNTATYEAVFYLRRKEDIWFDLILPIIDHYYQSNDRVMNWLISTRYQLKVFNAICRFSCLPFFFFYFISVLLSISQIRSGVVLSSSWPPQENPVLGLKTAACCPDPRPCSMWRTWQRDCSARMRWLLWWDTVGGWVPDLKWPSLMLQWFSPVCVFFPPTEWKSATTRKLKCAVLFPMLQSVL